ncbi:MAG: hypothetical protein QOJ29_4324 [Thermoleophilaceae bacterium]|nr:hypothetical protein [Thermoleophilaceae bacterium]
MVPAASLRIRLRVVGVSCLAEVPSSSAAMAGRARRAGAPAAQRRRARTRTRHVRRPGGGWGRTPGDGRRATGDGRRATGDRASGRPQRQPAAAHRRPPRRADRGPPSRCEGARAIRSSSDVSVSISASRPSSADIISRCGEHGRRASQKHMSCATRDRPLQRRAPRARSASTGRHGEFGWRAGLNSDSSRGGRGAVHRGLDEVGDGLGLRERDRVRGVDLDRLRAGALRHVALGVRMDRVVGRRDDRP